MITHKQLTLAEVFEDCQNKFDNDKYQFLALFDEAIDLDEIVPVSFVSHFHARTGRPRKHQLSACINCHSLPLQITPKAQKAPGRFRLAARGLSASYSRLP